jgi:hypothetical protein
MRPASLPYLACIAFLAIAHDATGGEAWILDSRTAANTKSCSLTRTERGRTLSVTLTMAPGAPDQGVVGLTFDGPKLTGRAKKTLATLRFDNGTAESHRIEATPAGLLIPIVALDLEDLLQTFAASRKLTVTTPSGSRALDLEGIGARIPALRDCARG